MYRVLIAGTVISTALVFQTQLNAGEENTSTELQQQQSNPAESQLTQTFEETKKTFLDQKPSSATLQIMVKELPMVPTEKSIKDFPSAIEESESDPVKIAQFYTDAAKAYEKNML